MAATNHLFSRALLLALLLAASGDAEAEQICEMAGVHISLGELSGNLYYVPEPDGYRVTATISSGDRATPLRFVATLVQGQSVVFSVPGKLGEPGQRLKVVRNGDRLFVTDEP
jgi:hypothetical protein